MLEEFQHLCRQGFLAISFTFLFSTEYYPKNLHNAFQISDFASAKADFGTDLAISTRSELDPGYTIRIHKSCNSYNW